MTARSLSSQTDHVSVCVREAEDKLDSTAVVELQAAEPTKAKEIEVSDALLVVVSQNHLADGIVRTHPDLSVGPLPTV